MKVRKYDGTLRRAISGCKRNAAGAAAMLLLFAATALAGPPLICHSIDIGTAESLPWSSSEWNLAGNETYDVGRLVTDTAGLLRPQTPVLVRMETIRRAIVYTQRRDGIAAELLAKLEARAKQDPKDALAAFDYGYLVETYKQMSWLEHNTDWVKGSGATPLDAGKVAGIDGYALVQKAIALRGSDAEMEFAAAIMSTEGTAAAARDSHLQKAIAGAKSNPLLARNIASHFPKAAA